MTPDSTAPTATAPDEDAPVMLRAATVRDFDAIARLLAELGRPQPTGEKRGQQLGTWERHLQRPETGSLVAHAGDRIIGFMSLEFRDRLNHVTQEAWIADMIVTPDYRGRNVGRMLLEAAVEEATRRGAHRLVLESEHHRERAHEFYLHAGLHDSGHYFTLDLR